MKKHTKWVGILLLLFFAIGVIAIGNYDNSGSSTPSPSPTAQVQPFNEPEQAGSNKLITHQELLRMIQENPNNIIGKTYVMELYLEQQPTNISAEFITQTDTNDKNTILLTCNMDPDDLKKLDGSSAQKGIYTKTYKTEVVFKEFDNSVGPYFKTDCVLK